MVGIGGRAHVKRCHQCRRRKIKCDGGVPACRRCTDSGRVCPGYKQKLEFVFFGSEPTTKTGSRKESLSKSSTKSLLPEQRIGVESRELIKDRAACLTKPHRNQTLNPVLDHSLSAPQNKLAFTTILHDRYVPDLYFPETYGAQKYGICSSWIAMTCSLASSTKYSDMLGDALLAMSMALAAAEGQPAHITTTGLKYYSQALTRLRRSLIRGPLDLDDHQADVSLVTCLSCGMYETMANRSLSSLMQHLGGVAAILRGRGVGRLQTPTSRRTFYEYRAIQLPVDLVLRQASFLSSQEWINPPWKQSEPQSITHLQTVIDIAFTIPVLMQKFDLVQQRTAQVPEETSHLESLYQLMIKALAVQRAFDNWELRLRGGDEISQLYIARLATSIKQSAVDNLESIYPVSFAFPTWDAASAAIYYDMSRIYLNGLLIAMQNAIYSSNTSSDMVNTQHVTIKSIACADRICQSIDWFFEDNKRMIGRMVVLAPFEAAKSLFA
ncbi:hypothetical protein ONS95_011107 [Cadophora gregata]|uniref:uncharacterized protein n=1 Tax=Cadophora gregata TaxID=51156 RepID=UPI0026DB90B5|nr:uncharacterized protein ONS95_011107 [Cadophora gregata]KAK0119670.1 hypothetical protein ONS95_011107 [Cadophora gregata]